MTDSTSDRMQMRAVSRSATAVLTMMKSAINGVSTVRTNAMLFDGQMESGMDNNPRVAIMATHLDVVARIAVSSCQRGRATAITTSMNGTSGLLSGMCESKGIVSCTLATARGTNAAREIR